MKKKRKAFPHKLKEKIFLKYDGKCADCSQLSNGGGWYKSNDYKWCNKKSFLTGGLEIHHIIPVFKGGKNNIKNLVLVCQKCHVIRHGGKPKEKELIFGY